MADSDDEYDRRSRGRDKFMKERSDFQDTRGGSVRRDFSGGDRRGYQYGGVREYKPFRGGRPDSPPNKRIKREWDEPGGGNLDASASAKRPGESGTTPAASVGTGVMQGHLGPMMSFKQFLATQDDSIADEEAIQKYQDYKLDYKRQQLHAFFIAHKDQEWFRMKYHPEDSTKKKQEQQAAVKKRLDVFLDLMAKGWVDKASMEYTNGRHLIKLMDALVVKLEGGTDEDLALLEKMEDYDEEEQFNSRSYDDQQPRDRDDRKESRESAQRPPADSDKPRRRSRDESGSAERRTSADDDRTREEEKSGGRTSKEDADVGEKPKKERKRKREENEDPLSDGEMSDKGSTRSSKSSVRSPGSVEGELGERSSVDEQPKRVENESTAASINRKSRSSAGDDEARPRRVKSESSPPPTSADRRQSSTPPPKENQPQMWLHKTSSIFLRNLAPTITKQEVESLCSRYPGFMRVSLAEPMADRRFYRRGWVTFRRDVNIKEICWNLNSIRLKDCDLGAIVNRDLTRRIRTVNGVTGHKQVAQNDLRLAARLVQICDKKWSLWQDENEDTSSNNKDQQFTTLEYQVASKNPLLKNITDYLIEEGSAEEEELLGLHSSNGGGLDDEQKVVLDRDDSILKVLDRLLVYLRLVHSIDYYNHCEYPSEEEMPNRCGLMHVRGPPPSANQWGQDERTGTPLISVQFITEFTKGFEQKLQPLLTPKERLSDEEFSKLGKKDPEKEVEAFITANCVELAKDKWLCPISGKKFKGPEFIRKHIANKHGENLDEVRVEVAYYNNYLADPKRPVDLDQSRQSTGTTPISSLIGGGGNYDRGGAGYNDYRGGGTDRPRDFGGGGRYGNSGGGGYGGYRDFGSGGYGAGGYRRDYYPRRDYGGGGGRGYGARGQPPPPHSDGRRDPRVPVAYTDLDAPEDMY